MQIQLAAARRRTLIRRRNPSPQAVIGIIGQQTRAPTLDWSVIGFESGVSADRAAGSCIWHHLRGSRSSRNEPEP